MPACLLPWQFAADTRSSVLGSPPPCSAVSNNSSPLTFRKQSHASVNRSESALSPNPCAESFSSVPPDALLSHLHPASRPGRLTSWESIPRHPRPGLLIGFGQRRDSRRISLLQCEICSLSGPGMIQLLANSCSLLGGHPISLWRFSLSSLIALFSNAGLVKGQPGSPKCSQGIGEENSMPSVQHGPVSSAGIRFAK